MKTAQLLRLIAALLMISAVVLAGFNWWRQSLDNAQARADTIAQTSKRASQVADAEARHAEALLLGFDLTLREFRDAIQAGDKAAAEAVINLSLAAFPKGSLIDFVVIDEKGFVIYPKVDGKDRTFLGDRDYFKFHSQSAQDRLFINKPLFGRLKDNWVLPITRPVLRDNRFAGVAIITLSPEYLSNILARLEMGSGDVLTLAFTDGTFLARSTNWQGMIGKNLPPDRPFLGDKAPPQGVFRILSSADNVPRMFAWKKLAQYPLLVLVGVDEGAMLAPLERGILQSEMRVAVITVLGLLLFAAFSVLLVKTARDITERKLAEQQLRIAATAFESQEGILITDADNVILRVNRAFSEITGYMTEEIVGQTPSLLKSGRHDDAYYADMWKSLDVQGFWEGEILNRRKNGEIYPEWLTITAVKDESGAVANYVATMTDITGRKEAEEKIRHLAYFDSLTELPNRRLLLDRLQQAVSMTARQQNYGALLLLDLDDFKTLNDTLGHDVGDALLKQVAARLTHCMREGDTVARLGGDEFVVIAAGLSAQESEAASKIEVILAKIIDRLNQNYQLGDIVHHSSVSIGVTLFKGDQTNCDELMKQADMAMYRSKSSGRNTWHFFDPLMESTVKERAVLEADLRQGLETNQLLIHYQAQVVEDGRVTGAEALVRWRHPQRGLVTPAYFIPLAEETGLILQLGHWVLMSACRQLAAWAKQPDRAHLMLAINVSARQFRHADFVDQVLEALKTTGANPHRLKLELTESLLVSDIEDVITKMLALKNQGVGFSLDDFGTGYSSLSYLKRLPLDQLKIDQSFVRDVLTDANDAAIAKMIVALSETMGLSVIAEGVELEDQRSFLAAHGCHAYQGYLFSRPLPLEEFEKVAGQA